MDKGNIEKIVKQIIVKNLGETGISLELNELGGDKKLGELGINSINFIKMVVNIETEFGFEFDDNDLDVNSEKFATISSFIDYIYLRISQ